MTAYYDITEKIRDYFQANPVITTTTIGDVTKVDIDKQTLMPIAHQVVNNVSEQNNVLQFNITILLMDLVDYSKENAKGQFKGNNNLQDVYNQLLVVALEFIGQAKRGSLFSDYYQILEDSVLIEPFEDRFENLLAGWALTFSITIPNQTGIC